MCQHLTIEEMIRLHRNPPPGAVRPTDRDLMEKLSTVVVESHLIDLAKVLYNGQYKRQLENLSTAEAVDRLMASVVMDLDYDPQSGRFITYARKNLFLYASQLVRDEKRGREAVLTHAAAGASVASSGLPQAAQDRGLQRALLKHGNTIIPQALIAAEHSDITESDKVIFAAALLAGFFPKLQACNGFEFFPLGKVGLRKLIAQTDMPAGTTNEIWGAILRWKSRKTQKKRPRRRGVQTLLAGCCGLSISTVSRSLASTRLRLAEPYKAAVARVVEAVRRERMESSADDPT